MDQPNNIASPHPARTSSAADCISSPSPSNGQHPTPVPLAASQSRKKTGEDDGLRVDIHAGIERAVERVAAQSAGRKDKE